MTKRIGRSGRLVAGRIVVGLMLAAFFLGFCVVSPAGDSTADAKAKGKETEKAKEKEVLVSKPKTGKAEEEKAVEVTCKKIKGDVSGIGSAFIMITYRKETKGGKKAEYDICLTIGKDFAAANKGTLSEIKVGHSVLVDYEEKRQEYEKKNKDGTVAQGTKVTGREAKKITFLNRGSKADGVLTSE